MGKIELKLSIYDFHIKRVYTLDNEKDGKKRKKFDNRISFEDFFKENYRGSDNSLITDKDMLFSLFAKDYNLSFNGDFKTNDAGTRAFIPNEVKFASQQNLIYGMVEGGITGIDRTIKSSKKPDTNSKALKNKLSKDDVATLPFYFLIWMPYDTNTGVLMIQSYTDESILGVFKKHLSTYFEGRDIGFTNRAFVPQKYQDDFYKKSKITQIIYKKARLGAAARNKFNPIFAELDKMSFELKLSKLSLSPESFFDNYKMDNDKYIGSDLSDLEMNENNDYETTVFYEDSKKRKAHIKLNKSVGIYPTIFLDNTLKMVGEEYPDFQKINSFCIELLKEIQIEKKYKTNAI